MRLAGHAAVSAAVLLLCGCAQQAVVRPSAAQLQALAPLPVVEVVAQDKLLAQDTFTAMSVNVVGPGVPIVAGALGGALGMAIVNAEMRAEARRFADAHVAPLLVALGDYDARGTVSDSLRQALAGQPKFFGGYAVQAGMPAGGQGAVIESSYAMTPDFSALQVVAHVSIRAAAGAAGQPIYRNVLIYQSPRVSVPAKTPADIQRMVATENARYAALDMDQRVDVANAALRHKDVSANRLRRDIVQDQLEHRRRLKQANAERWDADTMATQLATVWAADHGAALKSALRDSGPELAHMLQLDLFEHPSDARESHEAVVAFRNDQREIDYRPGGAMISMAVDDTDAGLKKLSPPVTVRVPVSTR